MSATDLIRPRWGVEWRINGRWRPCPGRWDSWFAAKAWARANGGRVVDCDEREREAKLRQQRHARTRAAIAAAAHQPASEADAFGKDDVVIP